MRLKKETYRHIEAEIRDYFETVTEIKSIRSNIISSRRNDVLKLATGTTGTTGNADSPTEYRATKLADSVLLREMTRITAVIREAYNHADDECRLILWGKYGLSFDWAPPEGIQAALKEYNRYTLDHAILTQKLRLSERSFYRARSWFIRLVAVKLGWY